MTRTRLAAVALSAVTALGLVLPAGSTLASPRADTSLLGPDQVTTGDHVPWDRVGPGWYLTLIDQGRAGELGIIADHQLLDLVDPLGGRYQLVKTSVGKDAAGYRSLADWSADGRSALELVMSASGSTSRAVLYDLPSGTHRSIRLGHHVAGATLGPDGSLYVAGYGGRRGQSVVRLDTDGSRHVIARHTDGQPLTTENTRRLVVGTNAFHDHRLLVLRSGGRVIRALTTPMKCRAQRWWRPGVVMASCFDRAGALCLYAAPVDGSRGHWLTADHGRHSADLGDLDARRLHGTTYLEASGPCGVVFLARQHRDGTATKVTVPKATENVWLLGTRGDSLVLRMGVSCDGSAARDAITHFDPATRHNRIVALLPLDEEYGRILAFGEREAPLA